MATSELPFPLAFFPLACFPLAFLLLACFPLAFCPLACFPLAVFPLAFLPLTCFPLAFFQLSNLAAACSSRTLCCTVTHHSAVLGLAMHALSCCSQVQAQVMTLYLAIHVTCSLTIHVDVTSTCYKYMSQSHITKTSNHRISAALGITPKHTNTCWIFRICTPASLFKASFSQEINIHRQQSQSLSHASIHLNTEREHRLCRYGLVYPGVGWIIWRNRSCVDESLIFHVNYLGTDQPSLNLNFSKNANMIVAQYYQVCPLDLLSVTLHALR